MIRAAAVGARGVLADPAVNVMCAEFADSSVNFDVDFWHGPVESDRRETSSNVVIAVHQALADAAIVIPFPQRTLWAGVGPTPSEGEAAERAD